MWLIMRTVMETVLLLACIVLCGCRQAPKPAPTAPPSPPPPARTGPPTVSVTVDPRMELLGVVQYLGGYTVLIRGDLPYKQEIEAHFAPLRGHRAVTLCSEMSARGFSYDAPPTAMLYLSPPPELALASPFSDYVCQRAGSRRQLDDFAEALRAFATESNFAEFFGSHQDYYARLVTDTQAMLGSGEDVASLEEYYGIRQHSYNIILAPLFLGSYGPRIESPAGGLDVYNIMGPMRVVKGLPDFGNAGTLKYLVVHEFGHSFVNPIAERFAKEANRYKQLYDPIADQMKSQAYSDWLTCVHEHIIRAVTARLASRSGDEQAAPRMLAKERDRGFRYIDPLYEALKTYETQRDVYPTFEAFYPELLKVFARLAEEGPDSQPPLTPSPAPPAH